MLCRPSLHAIRSEHGGFWQARKVLAGCICGGVLSRKLQLSLVPFIITPLRLALAQIRHVKKAASLWNQDTIHNDLQVTDEAGRNRFRSFLQELNGSLRRTKDANTN
jgi:hypothetical protein